jgi:hypothetical protein
LSRIPPTLAVALALAVFGASASAATAEGGHDRGTTSLKVVTKSQKKILRKRALLVRVKSTRSRRLKLRARSSTFDAPGLTKLAKPTRVKLPKSGRKTVKLRLNATSRQAIAQCEGREIQVSTRHSKTTFALKRDSAQCRPGAVDLSAADRCDFVGPQDGSLCLLPFPDDYYAVNDPSTRTGKRINLKTAAMPANANGVNIDAGPYNLNDGFSPGQSITLKVPGLDTAQAFANTNPVPINRLSEFQREDAPIAVIDTTTGERWPIWTELDSNANDPARRALLIHPAKNFAAGHRYIVALRDLKGADGTTLQAPAGFRYFRDDLPSKEPAIRDQRDRYESIFRTLRTAGFKRASLYLAWDFTVASDENIAGRVLHMRDEALADLDDTTMTDLVPQGTAPTFQVDTVDDFEPTDTGPTPDDANMARRVRGTFVVPCYLFPDCGPGGRMHLDASGMPERNGTYEANFDCMIPYAALADPGRPSLYGHGLLGSAAEVVAEPQKTLGNGHDIVSCATDEIGLSSEDLGNTIGILQQLGRFPELADRLQQGLLDEILLGRLMINPDGFASDDSFSSDGLGNGEVIDPSRLYYNGNSQGAIEGGALVAISPDLTRGSLGVGGMNYSVLLNRSKDFDQYGAVLKPSYPDELQRPLILSMIQMLWDRGESNGYAHRLSDDPLPNTPPHEVLMNVGLGDQQVSNFTAETMARTVGAGVHDPVLQPGRWPDTEIAWGIPRISSYPYSGSALVYWDSGPPRPNPTPGGVTPGPQLGTNPPPFENLPNRVGQDPHELPRRTVEEQAMVSDFLQPDAQSHIDEECGGPCFDFTVTGHRATGGP